MTLLAFFSLFSTWSGTSAEAAVQLCNRSNEKVWVGYANSWWCRNTGGPFDDPVYCHISKGWYEIAIGACRDFDVKGESLRVFANGERGSLWEGNDHDQKYCLKPKDAFEFKGEDNGVVVNEQECKRAGGEMHPFREVKNGFTFEGGKLPTSILRLKNNTPDTLYAAISFKRAGEWYTKGWFEIAPNQNRDITMGTYDGDVYVFAEANEYAKVWTGNGGAYCVDRTNAFEIPRADLVPCDAAQNRARFTFSKITLNLGKTFTWNFNP